MNALLSVSDKTGLVDFARGLNSLGVTMYATGGTERALRDAGIPVHALQELTGFPEMLDGRVKTLHPNVHAGILARRDEPRHLQELADRELKLIDLVVVNLYPFVETVSSGAGPAEAIESIDIGGVTLLRAAAKNHDHVLPVVRPSDYPAVLAALNDPVGIPASLRRHLAAVAFGHTAAYDAAIGDHLRSAQAQSSLPEDFTLGGHKLRDLRYGENPHQAAALYRTAGGGGIAGAKQWQGLELSYNNLLDAQAAWSLVGDFSTIAVAIIKHANPCGVALGKDPADAFDRALACDRRSAFGGIVAFNRPVDLAAAHALAAPFLEVVVAPSFANDALSALKAKPKLRVLQPGAGPAAIALEARPITGGFLVQTADHSGTTLGEARVVTLAEPDDQGWEDLQVAWTVVKHVRSNAIVLVHQAAAIGIGAGQMNRVEAVELAVHRAGPRAAGSVLASDGFFPYPDGVEVAARAGVRAIVQPGGSVKDSEAIAAADAAGVAMVLTGERHFKH
ncbi:MAG TPA: bifunctional phosphoribosylaminoimidazolecarboxamide formyltransferase/IMP cyclohydrolase [Candidatus Dormibacteraeota bacterium]|nr:bifunctional phosphoribosylaminoimidazolecarboxamide formyltransferase/IMP cyclohydrolase [Candidatus Dormibacteraeota bacterium]